jgi:class 3 adenylate cyclase
VRFGLKFKIGFLVSLLIIILLAVVGWFAWQRVESALQQEINAKGVALARSLASNVAEMLPSMAVSIDDTDISPQSPLPSTDTADVTLPPFTNDAASMDYAPLVYDHTRNTLNEASVLYAVVVYKDGRVFAQAESSNPSQHEADSEPKGIVTSPGSEKFKPYEGTELLPPNLPTGQNYVSVPIRWQSIPAVDVAVPIELRSANGASTRIGEVHVGISRLAAEKAASDLLTVMLIITAVGLAAGITGSILIGLMLTRSIDRLVVGVEHIGAGDFDVQIPVRSRDEIGKLTERVNRMARDLKDKEFIKDAFRRYVSHQVADQIFQNPEEYQKTLKGERRNVAILFADIRGFSTISEQKRPEEVVELLNDYLSDMTDVIFKFGGTLDKFLGDGVMAIYGAPIAQADAVQRAVQTALEMRQKLSRMNQERAQAGQNLISVGIGINYGEAIVGNIGSKQRMDYTVIGDNVNVASRIQTLAEKGSVLISQAAYDQIKDLVEVRHLGELALKGKTQLVVVYEVMRML